MFQKYQPDYYAEHIFALPVSFYQKRGIKTILCDLDNTLDSYRLYHPSSRVVEWKKEIDQAGIRVFIISNNRGERVQAYSSALGVTYLANTRKPFNRNLLRFLRKNDVDLNTCILIGDQLITDIRCAKRCKIASVLTEPIVKEDQWTTHFNRMIDRPIRKYLKKHQRLKLWKE